MTKTLIIITILIILYLYWKYQQNKSLPKTDDIIERKGKNDVEDFDLNSDEEELIDLPDVVPDVEKKDY